jgi:hypothetical protein
MNARTFVGGLVLAAVLLPTGAGAAPQILGLVATKGAVPLVCRDGACVVELTTFCLQEERRPPKPGIAYKPVRGDALYLVVTSKDGAVRELPAAGHVTIVSTRRGSSAVRIMLDARKLTALNAARFAVRVGRRAALVPVAVAGDPEPLSAAEIALASGPLWALAERLIERGGTRIEAARLVNRVINVLPRAGRATTKQRASAWTAALAGRPGAGERARAKAAAYYRSCRGLSSSKHGQFSLRQCLELKHWWLVHKFNIEYWHAGKLGM